MDFSSGLLSGARSRLEKLTGSSGNSFMCYLVGFCVFVFCVIWYMAR